MVACGARMLACLAVIATLLVAPPAEARHRRPRSPPSAVVLDGTTTHVRWIDGDTFRVLEGRWGGRSARLEGYNTLESYGPVHRWGTWSARDLLANARAATAIARAGSWSCTTRGDQDRYGRILVACPDVAAALVRTGHAMVFAVDAAPHAALVELQHRAQRRGDGMWAGGVPPLLVSSLHSIAEGGAHTYDRVVDTRSGEARRVRHERSYRTCEEVCVGAGDVPSCMLYVPFDHRYRGRPRCLRP